MKFRIIFFTIFEIVLAKQGSHINQGNHLGNLKHIPTPRHQRHHVIPAGHQIKHQNIHVNHVPQKPNHQHLLVQRLTNNHMQHVRPPRNNRHPLLNWLRNNHHVNSARPFTQRSTTQPPQPTSNSPSFTQNFNHWKNGWLSEHLDSCGRQNVHPYNMRLRIIGGREAKKGSWPWMVSFYFEPFKQHTCAGNLITDQWIVTAAHCFIAPFNITSLYLVRLGIQNSSQFSEEKSEQDFKIRKYIIHPEFDQGYPLNNDIALVKLDRPVTYTDYVTPICLPLDRTQRDGEECIVTGWGRLKNAGVGETGLDPTAWPDVLQQATIPLINWETCSNLQDYSDKLTKNMMCAGYRYGDKDTCQGDSGGPLQCQNNDQWLLTGITSWGGKDYTQCAEPLHPGVYTKVSNYINWVLIETFRDNVPLN